MKKSSLNVHNYGKIRLLFFVYNKFYILYIFFMHKKFQKMFGIVEKYDCELFIKIWAKNNLFQFFFQLYGGSAPIYPYFPPSGSWMKNNILELKTTVSRVLLLNVSESSPISKFSTFLLLRFWYKFDWCIFFMILTIFWLFIHCEKKIFFAHPKNFNF